MKRDFFRNSITPPICNWLRVSIFVIISMSMCLEILARDITSDDWKRIRDSEDYIIGMGVGADIDMARQSALNALISRISVSVQSQFSYIASEESKNGELVSEEKMNSIIKSYSSATLKNVEEYVEKKKDEYNVYRYMKRSEMYAMFSRRVGLARKWMYEGRRNEKAHKIGDALQNYYWSLALLRSCPDGDIEMIEDDLGEYNMMQHVHKCVKDILSNIEIKALSCEPDEENMHVTLGIYYKGEPAENFNYTLADDKNDQDIYTAKDGIGELTIPKKVKINRLKVNAEYECRHEANIHPDLRSVMESTSKVPFSAAIIKVDSKDCENVAYGGYVSESIKANSESTVTPVSGSQGDNADFMSVVKKIESALATRNYSGIEGCFTPEGLEMFNGLIRYGEAKLLRKPSLELVESGDGGMICRSFPMSFTFSKNRRVFTEDVVLYMNSNAKVEEIAFGLGREALGDIMSRKEWDGNSRQVMVHFLETYKTAYALKRLDYISSIFSSDALIITGSVVMVKGKSDIGVSLKKHVKYTRQTKEEYMTNLKKCFGSNEFVNIHFADNIVRRSHTNPNIYGIQIKQDYFSSRYGDTGYLFLLIDFKDEKAPLIHVRTWQPDLDPNIKDGRIGMADFML